MRPKIAFRNPHTYIVLLTDVVLLFFAYLAAYWLRFETISPDPAVHRFFWQSVIPLVGLKLVAFTVYGLESGMWRYTGIVDILNLAKATAISFAVVMVWIFFFHYSNITGVVSRSVFVIDAVLTILFIGMFRLAIRLFFDRGWGLRRILKAFHPSGGARRGEGGDGIPVVIYGANERGVLLLRSLLSGVGKTRYEPVGFVDDDHKYEGVHIHGYPVLSSMNRFEEIVERFSVRELLVASQLSGDRLERINAVCRGLGVSLRVVPPYLDSEREIDVSRLRDIRIEDLLNREPVSIDYSSVESALKGKRVLITGAGGSIGAQLASQIAEFGPSELILVDKSENYLHQLGVTLEKHRGTVGLRFEVADITMKERMTRLFSGTRPQFVFHAAAHKHVPLMEENKAEAVRNNIGGMKVVAGLAGEYGVERFILISTDKAVEPANVMGATKRICELYIQSLARTSRTMFMTVRFGNVLGSNGSVVPLFRRQIESRGPVTVTHKDVTRYFMTIPEAVLLILQAASTGRQGGLYILDMGEPVRIADLAEKMIRMAGFEPGRDIEIIFTGLRPGEKLTEKLADDADALAPTAHPKIYMVRNQAAAWTGVESLVEQALQDCAADPEGVCRRILSWTNHSPSARGSGGEARVIQMLPGGKSG